MQSLHKEILTQEQVDLLPLISAFRKDFGLVGGTAVALYIGHRESIDFDMFSEKKFGNLSLLNKIRKTHHAEEIVVNKEGELTLLINSVKFTFFQYPYHIPYPGDFDGIVRLPSLLTLAAMKAFALGQRNKWKDYVDLYFILRDHFSAEEISRHADELFGANFNGRMFRNQLSYFDDMNYREEVIFRPGFEVSDAEVKRALEDYSLA